jgi:biofilm PGA synthesis N-glycosyltransferase PgaC
MRLAAELLLAFVALYPVVTAAVWIAGGLLFRLLDEPMPKRDPARAWPGVTALIPAYNEEAVIAGSVRAALDVDYPELQLLVLDDGSGDATEAAALQAADGDPRCRVLRDPVNRGKAEQLNAGFAQAQHELVVVTDADTHLHPAAIRHLVARMETSPLLAAVAGAPHVTNRTRLICAMQVLEAASIIGLIRRTHMEVPSALRALWAQRKRWARGQGEALHTHPRAVSRWRQHRMWLLSVEPVASLARVVSMALALSLAIAAELADTPP